MAQVVDAVMEENREPLLKPRRRRWLFSRKPMVEEETEELYQCAPAPEPEPEEPVADPVFRRPDQMKGAFLLPGTDFLLSGEETAEEVKTQIDSALSQVQEWGFNTVLVPMRQGNTAL